MQLSKLCRKDIDKICAYCEYAANNFDENHVICIKKGAMLKTDYCRRFKYSPLKRIPPKRPKLKNPLGDCEWTL